MSKSLTDHMLSGPISHPDMKGFSRVPMRLEDEMYVIYIAHKFTRSFTRDNLPDVIKTKLAFIDSVGKVRGNHDTSNGIVLWMMIYVLPENEALHDVGWRVSDDIYCLVLDQPTIDLLVGRTLIEEQS